MAGGGASAGLGAHQGWVPGLTGHMGLIRAVEFGDRTVSALSVFALALDMRLFLLPVVLHTV